MNASFNLNVKKKKEITLWFIASIICFAAFCGYLFFINSVKNEELSSLKNIKSTLQDQVSNLEKKLTQKRSDSIYKDELKKIFNKLNLYSGSENKGFMGKFLSDLSTTVPPTIYLSSLSCNKKVDVKGYALDVQSILNLLRNLSSLPYINGGKIVSLKTSSYSDSLLEFLIKLDVKVDRENVKN